MKSLQVQQLKTGDVLSSGAKVISDPVAGLCTPKGKMEISIEYANGNRKLQTWGKYTTVSLKA